MCILKRNAIVSYGAGCNRSGWDFSGSTPTTRMHIPHWQDYSNDSFITAHKTFSKILEILTCTNFVRLKCVKCQYVFFRLPYLNYFGGVSAMSKHQFLKINGFPNNYWGWGGEDDDIFKRWANGIFNCDWINGTWVFIQKDVWQPLHTVNKVVGQLCIMIIINNIKLCWSYFTVIFNQILEQWCSKNILLALLLTLWKRYL